MKIIKSVNIAGINKQLINSNIILELNACGRGFIVINAEQKETFVNRVITINLGYNKEIQRWFTGYVENEQAAETGTKKLFIRELIGIYSKTFDCSFQHPTIKDITDFLTEKYKLKFALPNAEYINTKIPHFKHSGTGYHLLEAIGRAFNIPDFVYYQQQSGNIYLGSYNDCYFADKPLNLGEQLNKIALKTAGSDDITLPFMPKIRPGVILNNRRIEKVYLSNDEITITFANQEKTTFEKQLIKSCPEIDSKYHLPMFGRVIAISDICNSGNISTPFRPRYAVDVQLLDENGEDAKTPIYKAVPLPVNLMGWEKGIFCYPDIGSIVDIAFAYGRADKPIIRNVYPIDIAVPQVQHGEILLQQRPEVYQRIDKIGNTTRATDQELHDISRDHYITADYQQNEFVERQTTVKADCTTDVLGNQIINAGASSLTTVQDCGLAVGRNHYEYVKQNHEQTVDNAQTIKVGAGHSLSAKSINTSSSTTIQVTAQQISEQAQTMYSIIAGASVQIVAPTIWFGSNQINASQLMLDTLELIKKLADLTAAHNHGGDGPNNASAIKQISTNAGSLDNKYSPIIAK